MFQRYLVILRIMSTWIEQLSTWMEDQQALPPLEKDVTVCQIETLIDLSYEIRDVYTQVVEKLDARIDH
jgi:hypothetical protein